MDDLDSGSTGATPPAQPDRDPAFSDFYRRFVPTLVGFLMLQGARLPDAADAVQETMIKAYRHWSEIEQPKPWTRRVASRTWIRYITKVREDLVADPPEQSCLLRPLTTVEEWEQQHEVLRLLDRLASRQRQVLAWTLHGYTPSEIAEELRIKSEAVRSSLLKARRIITEHLSTARDEK